MGRIIVTSTFPSVSSMSFPNGLLPYSSLEKLHVAKSLSVVVYQCGLVLRAASSGLVAVSENHLISICEHCCSSFGLKNVQAVSG